MVPILALVYGWLLRRKKQWVLHYASVAIVKQATGSDLGWRRYLPPALFLMVTHHHVRVYSVGLGTVEGEVSSFEGMSRECRGTAARPSNAKGAGIGNRRRVFLRRLG